MIEKYRVTGLMSGSSMDGVDLACCDIEWNGQRWTYKILEAETFPYDDIILSKLEQACNWNSKEIEELDLELDIKKYQRSGLKNEDVADLVNKIRKYMVIKKPYLDRDLTIYNLSDQLRISRHTLSEVINEHMGMNFYNLVNEYRVKEVKQRMKDEDYRQLTILGIAYDSGFNSKSSFNTIFKEKTGLTPSQYLSELNAKNT